MGKVADFFGNGLTTATGVKQGDQTQLYDTPQQATTAAGVQSAIPTKMFDPNNVNFDDTGAVQLDPEKTPATTFKPGFLDAVRSSPTGLPDATSPKLTKGGKLLTMLTAAAKGAAAGTGSMSLGEGFQKGGDAVFQDAMRPQLAKQTIADTALKQSQVQMLPWQRAQLMATLGKTQAETGKFTADTHAANAKSTLDESEANAKKYLKGDDGVIYDLSGSSPKPISGQDSSFVPADPELVKINPTLKLGQPVPVGTATKLKALANSGIETINAGGRVKTVNKATNEVIKDWGPATPMVLNNINNPLGNTTGASNSGATGDDLLAKLSPSQQTLIKGVANYEIDPDASKTRGVSGAQARILAKQYNPDYDDTQYQVKKKLREDITSGTTAKVTRNLNTATGHLDQLSQAADSLDPSQFPALTKIANAVGFQVGSDKTTNFNAVKNAVVGELSSIYKGTGQATDSEIEHVGESVNAANSPEQLKGFINQAIHLMKSRLDSVEFGYNQGLKDPKAFNLISPSSQVVFASHGVQTSPTNQLTPGNPKAAPVKAPPASPLQQKYQSTIPGIVFPGAH